MGKIRDKMLDDLKLRGYRANTVRKYLAYARTFVAYYRRCPSTLGEPEIRAFLLHLMEEQQTAPATQAIYVAVLRFLYGVTLQRPEVAVLIPYPRVPVTLPDILSSEEVIALLDAMGSVKYRAVVTTMYAAGLRISEACALRPGDSHAHESCASPGRLAPGRFARAAGSPRPRRHRGPRPPAARRRAARRARGPGPSPHALRRSDAGPPHRSRGPRRPRPSHPRPRRAPLTSRGIPHARRDPCAYAGTP